MVEKLRLSDDMSNAMDYRRTIGHLLYCNDTFQAQQPKSTVFCDALQQQSERECW